MHREIKDARKLTHQYSMPTQNLLLETDPPLLHADVQLDLTLGDFRVQLGFQLADIVYHIIDMGCHWAISGRLASGLGADRDVSRLRT